MRVRPSFSHSSLVCRSHRSSLATGTENQNLTFRYEDEVVCSSELGARTNTDRERDTTCWNSRTPTNDRRMRPRGCDPPGHVDVGAVRRQRRHDECGYWADDVGEMREMRVGMEV